MSGIEGTHFKGPLLGSSEFFEDLPLGVVDRGRAIYKTWYEPFDVQMADTLLDGRGATTTAIGLPAADSEVITGAAPYLLVNPGTTANTGNNIQVVAAPSQATYTTPALRTFGPMTSTTTLMLGRELFWRQRVGVRSNATTWDGAMLLGVFVTDTSLIDATTGAPTVGTGGGIGFHIGIDGIMRAVCSQSAITSAAYGTANLAETVGVTIGSGAYALTANTFKWFTLGFRAKWDATTITQGQVQFYVNDVLVANFRKTSAMPISSTQVYSVSFPVINGAAQESDLAIDHILTGISRPVI